MKLPDGFTQFSVRCLPQAPAMKIGTQLSHGRHELTGPHLGDGRGQRLQGSEQFPLLRILVHDRSLTLGELARLRR